MTTKPQRIYCRCSGVTIIGCKEWACPSHPAKVRVLRNRNLFNCQIKKVYCRFVEVENVKSE